MFSFRTIGALTLAALLMVTLPACPSHAEESVAKDSMVQSKGELESSLSGVMARVNGMPITRREVDRVVNAWTKYPIWEVEQGIIDNELQ